MNQFGNNLTMHLYANDHEIGVIINGLKPNLKINQQILNERLTRLDKKINYSINSGLKASITTGLPLHITVKNENNLLLNSGIIRPNYGDLLHLERNNGYFNDNLFTGITTFPLTIAGLICEQILEDKYNIKILSHINSLHQHRDKQFDINCTNYEQFDYLKKDEFPVLDQRAKLLFFQQIKKAKNLKDTLGGSIETVIINLPKRLGSPFFNSFESIISHLLFSIPSMKGIIFGNGDQLTNYYGSQSIDSLYYADDQITCDTNYSGGINGGLTNGKIVNIKTFFKPPLPINQTINTINILKGEPEQFKSLIEMKPIIFHQFIPIVEGLISFVILDFLYSLNS